MVHGTFRADLLARLTGFTVVLPPLRKRREDLGALVGSLIARATQPPLDMPRAAPIELCPGAIRALYAHPWPGNVRELEKVISTALVLADGLPIDEEHLPEVVRTAPVSVSGPQQGDELHEGARARLDRLLALHRGNVNAVAREMHTSRTQIERLCRRFGIDLRAHRRGR